MKHLNFLKKTAVLVMAGAVGFSMFFSSINVYAADNTNNEKRPKYVFYFIGDGMGFSHIALTEAYLATEKGSVPGSVSLGFTQFPVMGMATTYSASNMITRSEERR